MVTFKRRPACEIAGLKYVAWDEPNGQVFYDGVRDAETLARRARIILARFQPRTHGRRGAGAQGVR